MESKENIIYRGLLIVGSVFFLVFFCFIINICRNRRKSLTVYFEKLRVDFSAIENEKRRTAAELHDAVGTYLSAIRMLTDEAFEKTQIDTVLRENIDRTFRSAFVSFRSVLRHSLPRTLQREGLYAAVRELNGILFPDEKTRVTFDFLLTRNIIPEDSLIHVYRIIQELLGNISKHAQAGTVTIMIRKEKRNLLIEIGDDGIGFTKEALRHSKGFGLGNIRNRVLLLRGDIFLDTSPQSGTRFQVVLPLFQD